MASLHGRVVVIGAVQYNCKNGVRSTGVATEISESAEARNGLSSDFTLRRFERTKVRR